MAAHLLAVHKRRGAMTIQEVKDRWSPGMKDPQAAIDWWNSRAGAFASRDIPTAQSSLAIRLITEKQMIERGQSSLDVGCGGGRFSFALEQLGACVTGIDFSPRMIEECEKSRIARASSACFCVQDWQNIDLQALGWKNKFDLVLANMTPAVVSADSFLKLSEASRNWCLMVKPTRRSNSILDKLNSLLELEADTNSLDEALLYAFELLWLNGKKPKIEYEEQQWENSWKTEDAVEEYTLRISSSHSLSSYQKEQIKDFLHRESIDNVIKETTHTTIAAVYWQV